VELGDDDKCINLPAHEQHGPAFVPAVPRLTSNVGTLQTLMTSELPAPLQPIRWKKMRMALYGLGDASKPAIGGSF
jgi:hypothetical protein